MVQKIIEKTNNQESLLLGTGHAAEPEKNLPEKVISRLKNKEVQDALSSIKTSISQNVPVDLAKIQKLFEKVAKSVQDLGLRMELGYDDKRGPLVTIYNQITNRKICTIPPSALMVMSSSSKSGGAEGSAQSEAAADTLQGTVTGNLNIII